MNNDKTALAFENLPEDLLQLTPGQIQEFSKVGYEKISTFLRKIDTTGDHALDFELNHLLNENIFQGNFSVVLGHAARIRDIRNDVGLDVGCSVGLKTLLLRLFGADRIYGCDVAPNLIKAANNWVSQGGLADSMVFRNNPIDGLPEFEEKFDWVTAMGLYANLNDDATANLFQACYEVTKPGGLFLFHDSANPHHPSTAKSIADYHYKMEVGEGSQENPDGPLAKERRQAIGSQAPSLNDEEVNALVVNTSYMTEQALKTSVEKYVESGELPDSVFRPDNIYRAPMSIFGNTCRRVTDPFLIKKELEACGYSVRFRRPVLGDYIDEQDLETYFSQAPGIFITAAKPA